MLVVAELVVVAAVVQLVEIVVVAGSVVAEDDLQTTAAHDASVADAVVVVAFAVPLYDASVECAGSSAGTAEEC